MLRIGHKGADALVPGNTLASFERAVEIGVDAIEFDVLWTEDGHPSLPPSERSQLVVAHDWKAASRAAAAGRQLTLDHALAAFNRSPLDRIAVHLDIKLPGREDEVIAAIHRHGLLGRVTASTMEISTLRRIGEVEPEIGLGWTVPKVTRDWTALPRFTRPALAVGVASVRARIPRQVRRGLEELPVESVWAYFGVVTPRLIEAVQGSGRKINVWTVDEPGRIAALRELGVDGICSNDPRMLSGQD